MPSVQMINDVALKHTVTVPASNSCTKCVGIPSIYTITRTIAIQFPGHVCMNDLTTERSFDSQATWVINVCLIILTCYLWLCVQPGTGRRPTGARTKWLYCRCITHQ